MLAMSNAAVDGTSDAPPPSSADQWFAHADYQPGQAFLPNQLLAELDGLRERCAGLQADNVALESLVYEKDKATRLLLANVEAWKQKLDLAEKRKIEDVQRLQAGITEKERALQYLVQSVNAMRAQVEGHRAAEAATLAGMQRLQELERENNTLLNILQGKCKDSPSMLQLLASLQTVKQDLRKHETENARLLCVLGQRDKHCAYLASRLEDTRSRVDRFAWDSGEAAAVRELVIERDRLRAQLAAVTGSRDVRQPPPPPQLLSQPQPQLQPQPTATLLSAVTAGSDLGFCDAGSGGVCEEVANANKDYNINLSPSLVNQDSTPAEEDKENCAGAGFATAPLQQPPPASPQILPIGSGRSVKRKQQPQLLGGAAKPKTPVKRSAENFADAAGGSGGIGAGSLLAGEFNRLAVGSGRAPLGQLTQ